MSLKNTSYFNPTLISGCSLWLDGADPAGNGVIPAVGASIATWADKSGQAQTITQATTGNQALYTLGGGLTFTSGMQYPLNTTVFMNIFSIAYTIFVVEKRATNGTGFFIGNNAGGGGPLYLGYNGNTAMRFTTAQVVDMDYTVPGYTGSDATEPIRIWACRWFGATANLRDTGLNGQITPQSQAFNLAPSFSGGNQTIGGCVYGNYVGKMYEMIIFNQAISNLAKQQIEGYLAWKWGLTPVVPVSHPYSLTPSFGLPSLVPNAPAKTRATYANHPVLAAGSCALWLDASDSSTISYSSGSNLSQWRDKSGNGYTMVNNTGTTTVASAELNSYNAIYTPSGTSAKIASFTGRTKFTLFFVGKCAAGRYLLGFNNGFLYAGNDTLLNITAPGNTFDCVDSVGLGTSVVSANTWFIFSIGYDNVAAFTPNPYNINGSPLNGANRTTVTSPYVTPSIVPDQYLSNPFYINSLGTNSYDSDYTAEIIFYNANLNVSQRQTIEGYLAQKWGLTGNLPVGHPFKSSFPLFPSPVTGVRRAGNRRWSPLNPGNCQLWLDAADSSTFTFTTGNYISVWRDKSTFNNGGTVNTTPKPLLRITSPSKQPSLYFDGTCGIPLGSSFTSSLCSNFIIVFAPTPAAQLTNAQYAGNGYGGQMLLINGGAQGGEIQIQPDSMRSLIGSWKYSYFASRIESYSIAQFEFNYGTSLMNLWQNGTLSASTAFSNGTATAPTQLGISEYFATFGVAPYIGDVAEIIYYSVSLSNPQRQQVEGYLAWKWGLKASLPSSHPYKLFPPSP
jgi:hypothetical protein